MSDSIYPLDPLLKNAARDGELVIFVGAGVSMLCGSPDWRGFANKVVNDLEKKKILRFIEAESLRGLGDARRTLSLARKLAKDNQVDINYDEILHPPEPDAQGVAFYEMLTGLRPVFVTTNYDKYLDETEYLPKTKAASSNDSDTPPGLPKERQLIDKPEQFTPDLLKERGVVIHLHGSYRSPESMVVSLRDYIHHYNHANVKALITEMFSKHTVLFVGYGLAELEILENIVRHNPYLQRANSDSRAAQNPQHFMLYPCRSTEQVQTSFITDFFLNQCGVRVIPYEIDNNGFYEIKNVFDAWSSELVINELSYIDLQVSLDAYIEHPNVINRQAAISLVRNHPEMRNYLLKSAKSIDWLTDFEEAGLLL